MERKLRIYHGPRNIGGIGRYLADWQRKRGAVSDFVVWFDNTNRNNSHLNLHLEAYPSKLAKAMIVLLHFFVCIIKYDIFHFYFGKSLLPINLDLPILRLFGKKMIMTYCGSDIRVMEVEKKRNPFYRKLNKGMNHEKYDAMKKRLMAWQALWIDRFFAAREMYTWASKVIPKRKIMNKDIWINNVHLNFKKEIKPYIPNKVPILVHAPTSPLIKGSEHVEEAVRRLRAEGYRFEYIRLEGVANDKANLVYRDQADIVIDQFYAGGFGNLACEGMFYGKPVCAFLMDELLQWYPDCPIVNCTVENLKEKLAWLIENPEVRVKFGKRGIAFVRKHCDREKINQKVWDLYQDLVNK